MKHKRKVVIFTNPTKTRMYYTSKENFDSLIFDGLKCIQLESFLNLEDAKQYLEETYDFDVEIIY